MVAVEESVGSFIGMNGVAFEKDGETKVVVERVGAVDGEDGVEAGRRIYVVPCPADGIDKGTLVRVDCLNEGVDANAGSFGRRPWWL